MPGAFGAVVFATAVKYVTRHPGKATIESSATLWTYCTPYDISHNHVTLSARQTSKNRLAAPPSAAAPPAVT